MARKILLFLGVAVFLIVGAKVSFADTLEISHEFGDWRAQINGDPSYNAPYMQTACQSFRPTSNFDISRLTVQLLYSGSVQSGANFYARIGSGSCSGPDTPIATSLNSILSDNLTTSFANYDFTFASGVSLISGNTYNFKIFTNPFNPEGYGSGNFERINIYTLADNYADGSFDSCNQNFVCNASPYGYGNFDAWFDIYGNSTVTPPSGPSVTAPTNLTVSTPSACAVNLRWDEGYASTTWFNLLRQVPPSTGITTIARLKNYLTGLTISGAGTGFNYSDNYFWNQVTQPGSTFYLDPGTTARYQIEACDIGGACANSLWSQYATPSLPNTFQNGTTGGPINITALADRGHIQIYFATSVNMSAKFPNYGGFWVNRSPAFSPSMPSSQQYIPAMQMPNGYNDLDNIAANLTYNYTLRFFESDYLCDPTRLTQLTLSPVAGVTIPSWPTGATAVYSRALNQITLSWTPPTTNNEDSYLMTRSTLADFSQNVVTLPQSLGRGSGYYNDTTNIQPGVTYYYRIRACTTSSNFRGCSQPAGAFISTASSISNLRADIVYVSPTNSTAKVSLIWDNNGVTGFTIRRNGVILISNLARAYFIDNNVPLSATPYVYEVTYQTDRASATVNLNIQGILSGVGWASASQGSSIGWVKFSSASENGSPASTIDYSVQYDNNGLVSGEAWASAGNDSNGNLHGYGWLSFNPSDLVGCPSAPTQTTIGPPCQALFSSGTQAMSGWARFLSPVLNAGVLSAWQGWVSLNNNNQLVLDRSLMKPLASLGSVFSPLASFLGLDKAVAASIFPYGVALDQASGRFSGAAWGDDVTGWLVFGPTQDSNGNPVCADCTVRLSTAASSTQTGTQVSNVVVAGSNWADPIPSYVITWNYFDSQNRPPVSTTLNFIRAGDATPTYTVAVQGNVTAYTFSDPLASLARNTVYTVEVQASVGMDLSNIARSAQFTTPPYYYPLVNFSWSPINFQVPAQVQFTDVTVDRSGGAGGNLNYSWQFMNSSVPTSNYQNPIIVIQQVPADATLCVIDANNRGSCLTQTLTGSVCSGSGCPPPTNLKRRVFKEL